VFALFFEQNTCQRSRDKDNDAVLNEFDSCPDVYNPLQQDDDDDGI
jgi:hypothetical protein